MSGVRSRSKYLVIGAATVSLLALASCGSGSDSDGSPASSSQNGPAKAGTVAKDSLKGATVTFVSFGGPAQEAQVDALDGFEETSGVKLVEDGPTEGAKIKAQVESGNVTWDVVDMADNWAVANCGTLLEKIDYTIVDTSQLSPGAKATDCGVPAVVTGNVLTYNTEKYGADSPASWADFYDTKKFPGKRGIFSGNPSVTLETALLADGVKPEDLYPLDVERALRKLDTIKEDIVFWEGGAQVQQMIESGQIDMGIVWTGRVFGAVNAGAKWATSPQQPFLTYDYFVIPKGSKNIKAANALINYYIGAEQQARVTELITYPGVNKNSKPRLTDTAQKFQVDQKPYADQQYLDLDFWSTNLGPLTDEWTTWING